MAAWMRGRRCGGHQDRFSLNQRSAVRYLQRAITKLMGEHRTTGEITCIAREVKEGKTRSHVEAASILADYVLNQDRAVPSAARGPCVDCGAPVPAFQVGRISAPCPKSPRGLPCNPVLAGPSSCPALAVHPAMYWGQSCAGCGWRPECSSSPAEGSPLSLLDEARLRTELGALRGLAKAVQAWRDMFWDDYGNPSRERQAVVDALEALPKTETEFTSHDTEKKR